MVAAYRDSHPNFGTGTAIAQTTMPTHLTNDVLLWHVWGQVTITLPTGGWTEIATHTRLGGFGANVAHKVYRKVAASGSETAPAATNGISDTWASVVTAISGADTTTPEDGTPTTAGNNAPVDCPAVTTTQTNSLLVCSASVWVTTNSTGEHFAPATSGMTQAEDFSNWDAFCVAYQQLSASGSTGARDLDDTGVTGAYITSSVAVRSATAPAPGSWVWSYGVGMG